MWGFRFETQDIIFNLTISILLVELKLKNYWYILIKLKININNYIIIATHTYIGINTIVLYLNSTHYNLYENMFFEKIKLHILHVFHMCRQEKWLYDGA